MPTPRAWCFDPLAPTTPAVVAWPAWLAFVALVMAVGLVERAADTAARIVTYARWIIGGALCDAGGAVLPPMPTPRRLASGPPMGACGARWLGAPPESLPGDGALWRLAIGPDGSASVVSNRRPGVVPGEGDLRGWFYAGQWSENFEAVSDACRAHNAPRTRDPVTVEAVLDHLMVKNAELMRRLAAGPREAAEGGRG